MKRSSKGTTEFVKDSKLNEEVYWIVESVENILLEAILFFLLTKPVPFHNLIPFYGIISEIGNKELQALVEKFEWRFITFLEGV